jgi:hypothetical protein
MTNVMRILRHRDIVSRRPAHLYGGREQTRVTTATGPVLPVRVRLGESQLEQMSSALASKAAGIADIGGLLRSAISGIGI